MRKCIISSPMTTQSGYGHHAREFIKQTMLNKSNDWDIQLVSMPWGHTPFTYPIPPEWSNKIIPLPLREQPDIWVQITVPNEFQPVGKFNIGVTAGTEGDIAPKEWIESINRMQLIIVPSTFSKQVLVNTADKHNLEITTTIQVISEYVNTSIYNKNNQMTEIKGLNEIYESFCFLYVGHWLSGQVGEDRKNITGTIHTFLETFKNKQKQPALILKTSGATYSITDKFEIERKIAELKRLFSENDKLPNIYLLHGDLTDSEMNSLYNHPKIKAMISLTKAEGFGRPLLEFTTTGKPIIAPLYSGPADFLNPNYMITVPGGLTDIHHSARNQFLIEGAKWFTPDYIAVKKIFKETVKHYNNFLTVSRKHIKYTNDNFSELSITKQYQNLFKDIENSITDIPVQKTLDLPKLNRISPKPRLPKLKTL